MRSKQYAIKVNQKAHDSVVAHAEEYNIPISAWVTLADAMLYKYYSEGGLPTLDHQTTPNAATEWLNKPGVSEELGRMEYFSRKHAMSLDKYMSAAMGVYEMTRDIARTIKDNPTQR